MITVELTEAEASAAMGALSYMMGAPAEWSAGASAGWKIAHAAQSAEANQAADWTAGGGKPPMLRVYRAEDLRDSQDDMLQCSHCGIVIDPGSGLVYLVGMKEGFHFYHQGQCADTALAEASS
jgi:hypothetical protein